MTVSRIAKRRRAIGAASLAGLTLGIGIHLAGCSVPVEHHDWSQYDGPGAEHFREPQYPLPFREDPLEPMNRVFVGVNSALVVALAEPVSSGWRQLVPQDVRTPLNRAANNLEYPRRGLNQLLQGDADAAKSETQRFAINSSVGVLGLNDAAAERGLTPADTDTGTTLKKAGWNDSVYLTLPFGMPGTARDMIGGVGDTLLDPTVYFFPAAPIKGFIQAAERMDAIERFVTTNQDPYEPMRRMYQARREAGPIASITGVEASAQSARDSLGYATLAPRDPAFDLTGRTRRVRIATTGDSLPYDVWMQDAPAPLVVLLPGFGTHRESYANMAIAELFFDAGYSVATISSVANFEFMRHAATAIHPGYLPADAADVERAVDAVRRDLDSEYGERVTQRALVGVSFGGAQTLYLAAQPQRDRRLHFDAYLAICPPIRFEHAAVALDGYYNVPLDFPEAERDDIAAAIMKKGSQLFMGGPAARQVEIDEIEASFLVGLSYRMALHDVIWVARQRHDAGVLKTKWNALQRASASQEILGYSMMKYAFAFLLPELLKSPAAIDAPEEMLEHSDVRRLEGLLRSRQNVGVAYNQNDFLLAPGDATWLHSVFGDDRLAASPDGGHLGNMNDDEHREAIVALLGRLFAR